MRIINLIGAFGGILISLLMSPIIVKADTFLVTNANSIGAGSLRQAVSDAELTMNADVINFDPTVFNTPQTIVFQDQYLITTPITINGPGKNLLTFTNTMPKHNFLVRAAGTLIINNVRFNGSGGIFSRGTLFLSDAFFDDVHGAVNRGEGLTVADSTSRCEIDRVEFMNSLNNTLGVGGAILFDSGILTIKDSTISNNEANVGAGINASGGGTINIINTTIANNTAYIPGGAGIDSFSSTTINLINSTIVYNRNLETDPENGGGILKGTNSTVTAINTIIANNTVSGNVGSPDFFGTLISRGNNLIKSTLGTNITGNTSGNIIGVDPMLAATLDFNGGTTRNYALLIGSPAIDAGNNCVVTDICFAALNEDFLAPILTDQRGVNRQVGSNVDIGAFEYIAPSAAEVSISGRIADKAGNGIARVRVSLTKPNGEILTATTNAFGFYKFENLEAGENYILQAASKRFQFQNNPRLISVSEDVQNEDFTGF